MQTDVARLLDDIWNKNPLCGGGERAPSLGEDLHEKLCKITASQT